MQIGSILSGLIDRQRSGQAGDFDRVYGSWEKIVGGAVAANTRPEAISGGILLVYVSSSVWIHQLQFLRTEIIENINRFLKSKRIEDIKFKIGPIESSALSKKPG